MNTTYNFNKCARALDDFVITKMKHGERVTIAALASMLSSAVGITEQVALQTIALYRQSSRRLVSKRGAQGGLYKGEAPPSKPKKTTCSKCLKECRAMHLKVCAKVPVVKKVPVANIKEPWWQDYKIVDVKKRQALEKLGWKFREPFPRNGEMVHSASFGDSMIFCETLFLGDCPRMLLDQISMKPPKIKSKAA